MNVVKLDSKESIKLPTLLVLKERGHLDLTYKRLDDEFDITSVELGQLNAHSLQGVDLILYCPSGRDSDVSACVRALRAETRRPIFVLGLGIPTETYVEALNLGADDFMNHAAASHSAEARVDELKARLRALLRRAQMHLSDHGELTCGSLVLSPGNRTVRFKGQPLELTRREHMVLERLMRSAGTVVPHDTILKELWGPHAHNRQYLRVYINRLRRKLTPYAPESLIETARGLGYRLRATS